MSNRNGWPIWSDKEGIKTMDDNHIRNTIAWIERKWDSLPDDDEHLVADHWSLTGVVFIPGKPWYKERLKELKEFQNQGNSSPKAQSKSNNKEQ